MKNDTLATVDVLTIQRALDRAMMTIELRRDELAMFRYAKENRLLDFNHNKDSIDFISKAQINQNKISDSILRIINLLFLFQAADKESLLELQSLQNKTRDRLNELHIDREKDMLEVEEALNQYVDHLIEQKQMLETLQQNVESLSHQGKQISSLQEGLENVWQKLENMQLLPPDENAPVSSASKEKMNDPIPPIQKTAENNALSFQTKALICISAIGGFGGLVLSILSLIF